MRIALGKILRARGLRVSLGGAVLFFAGLGALAFLPKALAVLAILAGGMLVWGGFLWTIFGYYSGQAAADDGADQPGLPTEPGSDGRASDRPAS